MTTLPTNFDMTAIQSDTPPLRLGIYGGSFDPVHIGHLVIAEQALELAHLSAVHFIPAAVPPHKQGQALTADRHRLEMLQIATAANARFVVDEREIRRGGVSYTVDTVRELRQAFPQAHLFLIIGSDTLQDLPNWKEPNALLAEVTLLVAPRPNTPLPAIEIVQPLLPETALASERVFFMMDCPHLEIASSDLRQRVQSGRSIRYLVPGGVLAYIQAQHLYTQSTTDPVV